jgi:hypothetical protein
MIDLEKSTELHRTTKARHGAGQVTKYDVDGAALAVRQNETAIDKNLNSRWTLTFMFRRPFML